MYDFLYLAIPILAVLFIGGYMFIKIKRRADWPMKFGGSKCVCAKNKSKLLAVKTKGGKKI